METEKATVEVDNKDVTEIENATMAVDDQEVTEIRKGIKGGWGTGCSPWPSYRTRKENSRPSCCT